MKKVNEFGIIIVFLLAIAFSICTLFHIYLSPRVPVERSIDVKINVVEREKLPDIIEQVKPGVVHISCPEWQGSGFVVSNI